MSDISSVEKVLKALASRRRLAIVKYLKATPKASVGQIAETIKLSLAATSRHLVILEYAGVLEREQVSTTAFYRLSRIQRGGIRETISAL